MKKTSEYACILGMRVDQTSLIHSRNLISGWSSQYVSKIVCVSNVHMCMEAYDDYEYQDCINTADLVVPDGKPLALGLRLLGKKQAQQVRGADLTRELLQIANNNNIVIGFYGGTEDAIKRITTIISHDYPDIKIGCAISPPFRRLVKQEQDEYIKQINRSSVQILFVGLGCPKQEKWMAKHRSDVRTVMIGVGAVFDFLSGVKKEAPVVLQNIGLEWLFRLLTEPKRLWRRYLIHNPRFIINFTKQILKNRYGKA
ncbi:MAG: WecB/TagA/CpsF family glycosyltransferase [Candidatus Thiodiazotropha endolucinida]